MSERPDIPQRGLAPYYDPLVEVLTDLRTTADDHEERVGALEPTVAGHTSSIATNTANIATNTSGIAGHETRLGAAEKRSTSQGRGLSLPNPGAARLLPPPTVMASPPTITPGSQGDSTQIANSVLIPFSSALFRYVGCRTTVGTGGNTAYTSPSFQAAWDGSALLYTPSPFGVEFDWYGQAFELLVKGTAQRYRLTVDGQGVDARSGRADAPSDGYAYLIKYDFGSAGFRRIRFDFEGNACFGGIRIGPTDSLWPPTRYIGPKVAIIGDSFVGGSTGLPGFSTFGDTLGALLGWRDVLLSGVGGTGYLANVSTTRPTYRTRLAKDVIAHNPEIVIVAGGTNDYVAAEGNNAALQTEIALLYQAIRAGLPNAALIVSGLQGVSGSPDMGSLGYIRDAIRAAAAIYADLYIEQIGGPYPRETPNSKYVNTGWMTGSGRVGATTGSGNSDLFRSTDSTHPTQAGHDFLGYRHAQVIAAAMPILGAS